MMAGRWVEPLAAEFPRMSLTLEAVDLPEDRTEILVLSELHLIESSWSGHVW